MISFDLRAFHPHRTDKFFFDFVVAQAIGLENLNHFSGLVLVPLPFGKELFEDLVLGVHVNDVDNNLLGLQKAVNAVDRLNKVIEFIINAHEYRTVTMTLKITARTADTFLCCEVLRFALGKIYDVLLPDVEILRAVYLDS